MKKRRAPHKQLIEAGKEARKILVDRKIILPQEQSIIDKIQKTPGAPMLPGIMPYIPYPWTINAVRRILLDLATAWRNEIDNNDPRKGVGIEFFKYVIEGLNRPQDVISQLIEKSGEEKTYELKFFSRKDTIEGIKRFLIDSFAISVIVKTHTDISEYLMWFDSWSMSLLKCWPENIQGIDGKKTYNNVQAPANTPRRI